MEIGEVRFEKVCTLDLDAVRALGRVQFQKMRKLSMLLAVLALIQVLLYLRFPGMGFYLPLFFVTIAILIPLLPWLTARSSLKAQQNLVRPIRYRFAEEAFSQEMELICSTISYRIIERIVLLNGYILLYPTGYTAYVLPLRNFAVGEAEALPGFLAGKTGKKVERIGRAR